MRTKTIGGLLVILLLLTVRVEASTASFNPSDTNVSAGQTSFVGITGNFAITWKAG